MRRSVLVYHTKPQYSEINLEIWLRLRGMTISTEYFRDPSRLQDIVTATIWEHFDLQCIMMV